MYMALALFNILYEDPRMATSPETQVSDYKDFDFDRSRIVTTRLLRFLTFLAVVAGIVIAVTRIPALSEFFSTYGHWWGEAILAFAIVLYLFLQKRYEQPRTKVVCSNDPLIIHMHELVHDAETHLYVDCAVLSRNIYVKDVEDALRYTHFIQNNPTHEVTDKTFIEHDDKRIETEWELVERVGSIENKGLLIEVHRHEKKRVRAEEEECLTYAIVFRGTVGLSSWVANAHWLVKWLPFQDQYDQIKYIVPELVDRILERHPEGESINIIATGHSLGGGLAQHACYISEKIETAYVFNSSPVTGYTDFAKWQRLLHMKGVKIYRMYERGEVLEALRFFMKIVYLYNPAPNENPCLSEHRFDFKDAGFINEHGMLPLAVSLSFLRDHKSHKFEIEEVEQKKHEDALNAARVKKEEVEVRRRSVRNTRAAEPV